LVSSGLRTSEIAALRVGNYLLRYGQASLVDYQGMEDKVRAADALEVPEFLQKVLRVIDLPTLDSRAPGHCLAHTIVSVTSGRSA
jgi:hypothetical protein